MMTGNIKALLTSLILLLTITGYTQQLKFWYPDGRPYKRVCKNINDINKDFDSMGRIKSFAPFCGEVDTDCFTHVGYKLFTDTPLYVMAESSEVAKKACEKGYFVLSEYLEGHDFEMDLDRFLSQKSITEGFILETLGVPDIKRRYSDGNTAIENWTYKNLIILTFHNSILHSYVR